MTREELIKVKNVLSAHLKSLAHYTSFYGVKPYWKTNEEYEEVNQDVANALAIIEKELNNEKENK